MMRSAVLMARILIRFFNFIIVLPVFTTPHEPEIATSHILHGTDANLYASALNRSK